MPMATKVIDVSRRHFLRGAGGFALALPFLTSLAERSAYGQATYVRRPRLFWLGTEHGGAYDSNMYPALAMTTDTAMAFADHPVRYGMLAPRTEGMDTVLSPILRARASSLTPALVRKMNVLRGLDISFYIGHNSGSHLGNYAANDGNGGDGQAVQRDPRPTIDQILAFSPTFYPDLASVRVRSMITSCGGKPLSYNYSNPSARTGTIDRVANVGSSLTLFNSIFVAPTTPTMPMPAPRPPVVDRVIESYRALRNGNERLSAGDRQRLDDHMDRLSELERRLTTPAAPPSASCSSVARPSDDANRHSANTFADVTRQAQLYADVIAAAFICGTSRIGVLGIGSGERFVDYVGDWHQSIAHQWNTAEVQPRIAQTYQRVFENVLVYLAGRLDVEEAPGMTFLDNSLLAWTQESGMSTHDSINTPVVTFGGAAGYFRTGLYVDYANRSRTGMTDDVMTAGGAMPMPYGLLYNQWLATVLQSMGLPRTEFERWGHRGYGVPYVSTEGWVPGHAYYQNTSSRYYQIASDPLPVIHV
jgi:hypothetical protein